MTRFEQRARQRNKLNISKMLKNGFLPKKRRSLKDPASGLMERVNGMFLPKVRFHLPLEFDLETATTLKMHVQVFISENSKLQGGPTILDLANMLQGCGDVHNLYAKGSSLSNSLAPKGLFSSIPRQLSRQRRGDIQINRRYELVHAIETLEAREGAANVRIASWDEALLILEEVLQLPDMKEVSGSNNNNSRDKVDEFVQRINTLELHERTAGMRTSQKIWRDVSNAALSPPIISKIAKGLEEADLERARRLEKEYERYEERGDREHKKVSEAERKRREKEAKLMIQSILRPLTPEDEARVRQVTSSSNGSDAQIVSQIGSDSVNCASMRTLRPGGWLTDEVIHFFLETLAVRDAELCAKNPNRKRSHFFKSFFITKLLNEGDLTKDGEYSYSNVKRWSKKVPGKLKARGIMSCRLAVVQVSHL